MTDAAQSSHRTTAGGEPVDCSGPILREARRFPFGLVCILAAGTSFAVLALYAPGIELLQPDSQGYIDFSPLRTIGYPLFLAMIRSLTGTLTAVPLIQLAFYVAAAWFLAHACHRLSGSRAGAVGIGLALCGNLELIKYCSTILSESLFCTVLTVALAATCRLLAGGGRGWLAVLSLATGAAILVRPAGYALIAALPVAVWTAAARRAGTRTWDGSNGFAPERPEPVWKRLGLDGFAVAGPLALVLALGMVAHHSQHGGWRTQSFLGSNLYGKAARLATPETPSTRPEVMAWIGAETAAAHRVIEAMPDWRSRYLLLAPYYDQWRWHTVYQELPARAGLSGASVAEMDGLMLALARELILAHPWGYLGDVGLNLMALWTMPDAMTRDEATRFRELIAGHEPLPELGRFPFALTGGRAPLVLGLRGVLLAALAASSLALVVWGVALARGRLSTLAPEWSLAAVAAVQAHASYLLIALTQAGLPRYSWSMWPALVTVGISVIVALLSRKSSGEIRPT